MDNKHPKFDDRLKRLYGLFNAKKSNLSNSAKRLIEKQLLQIANDPKISEDEFYNQVQKLINSPMFNPKGDYRL